MGARVSLPPVDGMYVKRCRLSSSDVPVALAIRSDWSVISRTKHVTKNNSRMICSCWLLHLDRSWGNQSSTCWNLGFKYECWQEKKSDLPGQSKPLRALLLSQWRCAPSMLNVIELALPSRLATESNEPKTSIASTLTFDRSPCAAKFTVCLPQFFNLLPDAFLNVMSEFGSHGQSEKSASPQRRHVTGLRPARVSVTIL